MSQVHAQGDYSHIDSDYINLDIADRSDSDCGFRVSDSIACLALRGPELLGRWGMAVGASENR